VLLKPPVEPATYVLWFGPAAVLAAGALGAVLYLRRRPRQLAEPVPLSEGERQRLAQLVAEDER